VSSAPRTDPAVVAIFAKAPRPGTVKTRLAARLGDEGAARLHALLAERTFTTALAAGVGPVEVWCAPDEHDAFFASMAARGATLQRQPDGDLGHRMQAACDRAFAAGRRIVLLGCDCPALQAADVDEAVRALASHGAALSPAEDGGYVMLALSRPAPVFDAMPWGTGEVMSITRERLRAAGIAWRELRTLWDVDVPGDYDRLVRERLIDALPA
jgi:rSAM/selenodomain-associated transferase 1